MMTKTLPVKNLPPGTMKRFVLNDRILCFYHLSDGIYATDDTCSHAQASLSMGQLMEDSCVECPRHGSRFDVRTGQPVSLPAIIPLKTYPTEIKDDYIYVELPNT